MHTAIKLASPLLASLTVSCALANPSAVWAQAAAVERIDLGKSFVYPGESSVVTVRTNTPSGGSEQVTLALYNRLGSPLHSETRAIGTAMNFTIPAQAGEGPLRLAVVIDTGSEVDRVYSVVASPAYDVRYGFFAKYDSPSQDFISKARILADLHLTAMEYYDYFPGHGDYAPTDSVYYNQPFNVGPIYAANINGKCAADRARNIANIAYIAAYSAIPSIAATTPDYLLDSNDVPLVFFNGSVGTEAGLGGVWFDLMAFAPDTNWYNYLTAELMSALDDSPTDQVQFDGFEVDTYGYQGTYNSTGSSYNGQSIADVLAVFCGNLRDMTRSVVPHGLVATNTIAEDNIDTIYDKVDFLFVENWAYHLPRYDDVARMCFERTAESGKRLVSKSYPADTNLGVSAWPETNLRMLMAAHLSGGGTLMIAGEPDETTGQIGGFNSLYYPDYTLQTQQNYAAIRRSNALDAALYGRTHGLRVRPRATDLNVPGSIVQSFDAVDGARTWCFLHLDGATTWTDSTSPPSILTNEPVTVTLPNGMKPAAVLYGTPDEDAALYPRAIPFTEGNRQITIQVPRLEYFGALIVEPEALPTRASDSAAEDVYTPGWVGSTGGGSGWAGDWQFSGQDATAGVFVGDSTTNGAGASNGDGNINSGLRAWGMYSGNAGLVGVTRDFPALQQGEAIRLHLDNGFVSSGGAVGFDLRNASATRLMGFEFRGGEGSYTVIDTLGDRATSLPFTDQGLDVEVLMNSATNFTLRAVPLGSESEAISATGDLVTSVDPSVVRIRLFSYRAGVGAACDAFFNDISIYRLVPEATGVGTWSLF